MVDMSAQQRVYKSFVAMLTNNHCRLNMGKDTVESIPTGCINMQWLIVLVANVWFILRFLGVLYVHCICQSVIEMLNIFIYMILINSQVFCIEPL